MNDLQYYRPRHLKEALEILDHRDPETTLLSGGTNLLVDWRSGKICPKLLLDIFHLKELNFIEDNGDSISIGSTTTMKAIADSPIIPKFAKSLGEAAKQIGSPQIRNRATLGGNIVSSSPAADTLPPLLTLEATLRLKSLNEEREISLSSFLKGPKATDLRANEILIDIRFAKPSSREMGKFIKLGRRNALAISVVNMAVMIIMKNSHKEIEEARIALGAVAPKAFRADKAEKFLKGKILDHDAICRAAEIAADQCQPISDIRGIAQGRRTLVKIWLEKILSEFSY